MSAVAAVARELPGFQAGREHERELIAKALRRRAASAKALAKQGRIGADEAERLAHWLSVAADDVLADLEDD